MATIADSRKGTEFHWGAILAGSFVALGMWVLLYTLGAAIGLTGANPQSDGFGTWTAIYTLVAPIVSLFVGGLLAGRGAGVDTRASGSLHGLVLWGFSSVVATFVLGTMSLLVGAVDIPVGYGWAIFASYFLSLIGAVLGGAISAVQPGSRKRIEIPVRHEREVYP